MHGKWFVRVGYDGSGGRQWHPDSISGIMKNDFFKRNSSATATTWIKESRLFGAETLARNQARAKATIDKFKERLQKTRVDLREVEDRLDALQSEVRFR